MSVKKQILRALAFVLIISSIAVMFTGCGDSSAKANAYRSIAGADIESQVLASDSEAELSWDLDAKAVVYKTLENGAYWSDILYDAFKAGDISANGNSPISITVVDTKTFNQDIITSYTEKEKQRLNIVCKKIENGIRITYFFDFYKIAVPIEYKLENGNLRITLMTANILEDGTDYKLTSVAIAPYLCSVSNDALNGNLLVPTGTGALMNVEERAEGVRKYTGEMFGEDAARRNPNDSTDDEAVRIPVFGAYGDSKGIMGIIDKGAGSAEINAQAGNKRGYSNIYVTFNVRGYDSFEYSYHGDYQGIRERQNENISTQEMSVLYYTLYGEDADYNGMAKKYREYLIQKDLLKENTSKNSAYGVTFWGGTGITKSILGIPDKETVALTTFSQANSIVKELEKKIGLPAVRMLGYGDNGLSAGTIAGGKKYLSVYGKKDDLAALIKTTDKTEFFMDSDIINFNKSGAGINVSSHTAKTAVMYKAEQYQITPIRTFDETSVQYAVQRAKLSKVSEIAVEKADKYGYNGISLSTLGTTAYSDYTDDAYITKGGMDTDVKSIINNIKKQGYKIAVAGANSYAACAADTLFDIAVDNGNYSVFDEEVPFYQLVFHSYRPMYSSAVNLYENIDYAIAKSVAYGMGLGYALIGDYISESDYLDEYKLYATLYDDNKDGMYEALITNGYKDIYSKIADSEIESYILNDNGVSITTYSNGIKVYVNHTKSRAESPVGDLEPYAFSMS